jgi:hypothetical protein
MSAITRRLHPSKPTRCSCVSFSLLHPQLHVTDIASYPIIDGTYLTTPGLSFTNISNTRLLIGTVRYDGGITVPDPASANLTQAFDTLNSLLNLNLTSLISSPAFPLPSISANASLNNFNLTSRIVTDGGLYCLGLATTYSSSLHHTFPSVYSYLFNRTYQPPLSPTMSASLPNLPLIPSGI